MYPIPTKSLDKIIWLEIFPFNYKSWFYATVLYEMSEI